jgi:hypothetical protein
MEFSESELVPDLGWVLLVLVIEVGPSEVLKVKCNHAMYFCHFVVEQASRI